MSLIFITGIAGSGKSEVVKELKRRGYEAYDTDDDGFAKWQDHETGYIHPKSSVKKADRTEAFLKIHSWVVPRQELKKLWNRAKGNNLFLCGVASNETEIQDLFNIRFELVIDDKTLKQRLLTRTSNDWGKQPHELQHTLEVQSTLSKTLKNTDKIVIDATQSVTIVVDEILENLKEKDI